MTALAAPSETLRPPSLEFASWRELARRQPVLASVGLLCFLAIIPLVLAGFIDTRTVHGINVWVKPVKFLVAIGLYLWTLAWFFGYLGDQARRSLAGRYVIHGTTAFITLELAWIIGMSAAGQASHFNRGSPMAAILYSLAGIGAVGLTASLLVQGILLARDRSVRLAPAFRLSLVLGSVLAFAGTLAFAGFMASGQGHWVGGVPSDAGGMPLMGWSRTGGDLRVAHFWATHAQQVIPLVGALLVRTRAGWSTAGVWAAAAAYTGFVVFTFAQALAGQPFLGG